jgi:hypothetical protein
VVDVKGHLVDFQGCLEDVKGYLVDGKGPVMLHDIAARDLLWVVRGIL